MSRMLLTGLFLAYHVSMHALLILLLAAPADTAPTDVATIYRSEKTLPQLQECLTTRLSASGDVVAVQAEGYITLIYRDGTHRPTVIDLAPLKSS